MAGHRRKWLHCLRVKFLEIRASVLSFTWKDVMGAEHSSHCYRTCPLFCLLTIITSNYGDQDLLGVFFSGISSLRKQ